MADLVTRATTYAPSMIIICEEREGGRAKTETKNVTAGIETEEYERPRADGFLCAYERRLSN